MKGYYITTPIFYVNDVPHIGHAYTTITCDVFARWHRLKGEKVFFLTGTDENGEKIAKAAEAAHIKPGAFVDKIVVRYKECWKELNVSYDDFIRTTEKRHAQTVSLFIEKVNSNGDLYKGEYEGWYCVSDETFLTELQLKDGKCPMCGREVKKVKEESWFFKLSAYQDRLLQHYIANPGFLSPGFRSEEIINRVKAGLKDLSITRTNVSWGIPFPLDKGHTVYVWFEALINYLSALGWPDDADMEFWPADVHMVGKEINWFHSVIWPAMLMSAGMELPKKVFAHGWWTVDGKKMGKSMGNAIDPIAISKKYSVDALRYFMLREIPLGADGDFSEKALVGRLNNELAADLGNLLHRVMSIAEGFTGKIEGTQELSDSLDMKRIDELMEGMDTFGALDEIWKFIRSCNKYVNDKRPWELQGSAKAQCLYNLLEACRITSILISPFMPSTSEKMNKQLGVKQGTLLDCEFRQFTGKLSKKEILFTKVDQL